MKKSFVFAFLISAFHLISAQGTQEITVMHYNLLSFGPSCPGAVLSERYGWLTEIVEEVQPDILTVNEIGNETAYSSNIVNFAFSYNPAMAFGDQSLKDHNSSIINQIFFNSDLFTYVGEDVITGNIRDINVYTLYVNTTAGEAGSDTAFLHCIVAHLKASTGTSNVNARAAAAQDIMSWVEQNGKENANVLLLGDMNVYSSGEAAFQAFVGHSNPDIRFQDPGNWQSGWGGASNSLAHTQSTRSSSTDCGSGGGMDDRFDMILASSAVMDGSDRVQYVSDSYTAVGNNGASYNTTLSCAGNNSVPTDVCLALRKMSDHLPVVLKLTVPAVPTALGPALIPGLKSHLYQQADQWFLHLNQDQPQELVLSLTNMAGQLMVRETFKRPIGEFDIELPNLPVGLYMLRLQDQAGRHSLHKMVLGQ